MLNNLPENSSLIQRLDAVRQRIDEVALRCGREAGSVVLLPVSKTFGVDVIRQAIEAGEHRFGENKAQDIRDKHPMLSDYGVQWVMIGHLQTNKAKDIAKLASEIQSLDRRELAIALDRRLQQEGRSLDALVQVKTSSEPTKFGMEPTEVEDFLRFLARDITTIRVRGLMTVAVNESNDAAVRNCFRQLRQLRDRLREEAIDGISLDRLSMGMSGDFDIAIEEGSTEVRIGSAIFGARNYGAPDTEITTD